MFECLILGDSTGVGTAHAINARYERRCDVQAAERATAAHKAAVECRMQPHLQT